MMTNPKPAETQIIYLPLLSRMITDTENFYSSVSLLQKLGISDPSQQEELKTAIIIRHRYKLSSIMTRLFSPINHTLWRPYSKPGETNKIMAQVSQGILPIGSRDLLILSDHLIHHPSAGTPEIRDHVASWWAQGRQWERGGEDDADD